MAEAVSEPLHAIEDFGVLRGLSNAGDPLLMLGILFGEFTTSSTRLWVIDNRAVDTQLHPDDLEQFLAQVDQGSSELWDVAIAWVGSSSWGYSSQLLPDSFPIRFEIFEDIGKARDWLKALA
jgi:hypothetical protein